MNFFWILDICMCLYVIAIVVLPIIYLIYRLRLQHIEDQIEQAEYEMAMTVGFVPVDIIRDEIIRD